MQQKGKANKKAALSPWNFSIKRVAAGVTLAASFSTVVMPVPESSAMSIVVPFFFDSDGDDNQCSDGATAPKATNEDQANLKDNVESFGSGMKAKGNTITISDEKVTSPIAGKVTNVSDSEVTIESTRPGQDTTVVVKDIEIDSGIKKGNNITAGKTLGKAKKNGDDYSFTVSIKDDGKDKTAEEWYEEASKKAGSNSSSKDSSNAQTPIGESPDRGKTGAEAADGEYNADQVAIIKTIIAVGEQMKSKGITKKDIEVALATSSVETTFQNYGNYGGLPWKGKQPTNGVASPIGGSGSMIPGGSKELQKSMDDPRLTTESDSDLNSLGIYQQQATLNSDGTQNLNKDENVWGRWEAIVNTNYAAQKFYETMLERMPDDSSRQSLSFYEHAHNVQGSAFPDRVQEAKSTGEKLYSKYKGAGKSSDVELYSDINDAGVNLNSTSSRGSVSGDEECVGSTASAGERGGQMGVRAGTLAANILKFAEGEVGKPYSQAAGKRSMLLDTDPSHHDCSSFVSWIYWYGAGVWLSEDDTGWGWNTGTFDAKWRNNKDIKVYEGPSSGVDPKKDLKPGDIINMDSHVYIYAGDNSEYAAHTDGVPLSKSDTWDADVVSEPIRVYRPLNADNPKDVSGNGNPPKDPPSEVMKMWKSNKKW